jgi:hypothetical protein
MWAEITDTHTGELHYRGNVSRVETGARERDGATYVAYDAMTCQYLPSDRYVISLSTRRPDGATETAPPPTDDAPRAVEARCIRCGNIGADPDLGNVCLDCDYDTGGDYDAPTDHAGTVIAARARVELLDDHDKGTVTHTGNVLDDGTVTVMLDGARGTRGIAPHRLNVITPDAPHTGSRAIPAPGALAHTDAPSASVARALQGSDIGRA